jgi:hypothetical protein
MRNPLLIFFTGYKINRYFTRLTLPFSFALQNKCKKTPTLQSGTCPWRSLHTQWILSKSNTKMLLDFSQLKQYKLGFDSTLPQVKSIKKLKELGRLDFNISYDTLVNDIVFYNFFFNHGVYGTTSNHMLPLWYKGYRQVFALAKLQQKQRRHYLSGLSGLWGGVWSHESLLWSLLASGKLNLIGLSGYMSDALVEEYEEFFLTLSPYEQLNLTKDITDEYYLETDDNLYIRPEFFANHDITLSNVIQPASPGYAYTQYAVIKLLEDKFFSANSNITLRCSFEQRALFFRLLLVGLSVVD